MANIYDDLAAAAAQAQEEIARTGQVSGATAQRLQQANTAVAEFEKKIDLASNATMSLVRTFTTYNRAVTEGVKGYKDLASTTDQLATSIEALSAALAFVLPIGRVAKVAVAGLGLLAGELVRNSKLIGEQIDGLRSGFDELAQVGGTTAGGLTDMFEAMQKVGLSVKDFPGFAKALGEQSELLSRFGGTVNTGRNAVLNLADDLKPMRNELQNFGIRVEQLGEASLGFIKTQRLSTLGNRANMDLSTKSMMAYVKELDTITRLTGISRKEQEKTMEEAMRHDAFVATYDDMVAQGRKEEADVLLQNLAFYKKRGPTFLKAYMDSVSGFIGTTDEASQGFMASQGGIQEQVDQIKSGMIKKEDLAESNKKLDGAISEVAETIGRGAAMLGTQFGLPYNEMRNAIQGATADITKALGSIADEQKKTDPVLKKNNEMLINAQDAMIRNQKVLMDMTGAYMSGIDKTTGALDTLTNAAIAAANSLWDIATGKKMPKSTAADASKGTIKGATKAIPTGPTIAGNPSGVGKNAKFNTDEIAAAQEAIKDPGISARDKAYYTSILNRATSGGTPEDTKNGAVDSLTGKTSGVNPTLLERLGQAAAELGKTVQIVSGERSYEKQTELYNNYLAGKSRFPVAPPGTSKHERGQAVDIEEGLANELDKQGLLKKYGLARPVANDPIHIEMFENGGTIGAGKLGLVGENGKPEIVQGPATVSPNNDIMAALKDMVAALDRSTNILDRIDRNTMNSADANDRMLRLAQN